MRAAQTKLLQLKALVTIFTFFKNPLTILLLRLGFLRFPYFIYRIAKAGRQFQMLARPTQSSMADLFVLREVLVEETYRDILRLIGKKNIRLVDVGANLGSFTIWIHRCVGLREAYCFEPEPDSFRLLTFNLSKNDCAHARALPVALGGSDREVPFSLKASSPGGTSMYQAVVDPEHTGIAKVISFSSWLQSTEGDFDLLKIDCEGAEWEIIDNTPPAAWSRFGLIVAEVHQVPGVNHQPDDFPRLMEERGFKTERWDGGHMGLYIGVRRSS